MSRLTEAILRQWTPVPIPGQAEIFPELPPTLRTPPWPEPPMLDLSRPAACPGFCLTAEMWRPWPPDSPQTELFPPLH